MQDVGSAGTSITLLLVLCLGPRLGTLFAIRRTVGPTVIVRRWFERDFDRASRYDSLFDVPDPALLLR